MFCSFGSNCFPLREKTQVWNGYEVHGSEHGDTIIVCLHKYSGKMGCTNSLYVTCILSDFIGSNFLSELQIRSVCKGVTAYTQIRRCVVKFCQIDKILTHTCISDGAESL